MIYTELTKGVGAVMGKIKPVEKLYLSEENVAYIARVGTAGLVKDLTKKGHKSALYKEAMALIGGIKYKYNFDRGVLNSIIQKTWLDNKQFTESAMTAYAEELKKFKVSTVTEALNIFLAIDDLKERERISKEEEIEKKNKREEEQAKAKERLEDAQANWEVIEKKRLEEQIAQRLALKEKQEAERQKAVEFEMEKEKA
jgi:hypothetical protein